MSTNLAETIPLGLPLPTRRAEEHPRHIEIVSTRSQRRARPRPIYAIVIVGGLFVLFIAQLLMSIVVSNGAYQISGLQTEQRTLTQTENALKEKSNLLSSPMNVAYMADKLGMVETDQTPNFVSLPDGKIIGSKKAVSDSTPLGPNRIANAPLKAARSDARKADKAGSGETTQTPTTQTPATDSLLPGISQ